MKKLTPKQEMFCKEYIKDLNGAQAAIRAGYSEETAKEIASENLTKPNIKSRIQELMEKRSSKVEVSAEMVLRELVHLATVDLSEAYNPDGTIKPLQEIPEPIRRAIAGFEQVEEFEGTGRDRVQVGYKKKIKFYDKTKALELIGKHLKLFTDKVEHSGTVSFADLVVGSFNKGTDGKDNDND